MASIIDLPYELLWAIIEQLPGKTISICIQVCKRLSEIANNDTLWKNICHKKKWDSVAIGIAQTIKHSAKSKSEKQKIPKKLKKKSNKDEITINWKKVYRFIDFDQKLKLRLLYNDYFSVNQYDLSWRTECKSKNINPLLNTNNSYHQLSLMAINLGQSPKKLQCVVSCDI